MRVMIVYDADGACVNDDRQAAGAAQDRPPGSRRELPGDQGQSVAARRAGPGRAMGQETGSPAAHSPADRVRPSGPISADHHDGGISMARHLAGYRAQHHLGESSATT